MVLLFGCDANAGVADREAQARLATRQIGSFHRKRDASAGCELARVAGKVAQNLPYAQPVPHDVFRHVGCYADVQGNTAAFDSGLHHLVDELHEFPHIDSGMLNAELACLNLGVVQDVVDDAQQVLRRMLYFVEVLMPLGGLYFALQKVGKPQNRVERRANFVAHAGQE